MSDFNTSSDSESEPLVTETLTKESKSTAQPQKKHLHSVILISDSKSPPSPSQLGSGNAIVHTPSPPESVPALVKDAYYTSPDHLHLHEALICGGGETEIKVVEKCKTVTFYEL